MKQEPRKIQQEQRQIHQELNVIDTGPMLDVHSPFNSSMGTNLAAYAVIDDTDASAAGMAVVVCDRYRNSQHRSHVCLRCIVPAATMAWGPVVKVK